MTSIERFASSRRLLLLLLALAAGGLACASPPLHARSEIVARMRGAFTGTVMACTDEEAKLIEVLQTERTGFEFLPGFKAWGDEDMIALDALRYGTIVRLDIAQVTWVKPGGWAPRTQPMPKLDVVRIRGEVKEVLKGRAPLGPVEFTAVGNELPRPIRFCFNCGRRGVGGHGYWAEGEGLLFLPVDEVPDPLLLGCLEAHFVSTRGESTRPYGEDMTRALRFLQQEGTEALASAAVDSPALQDLLEGGGLTMGFFVADRASWRVLLSLLAAHPPTPAPRSPLQLGLFEGAVRVFELFQIHGYRPPGWSDVEPEEVRRALLRWAIQDIAAHGLASWKESRAWFLWANLTSGRTPSPDDLQLEAPIRQTLARRTKGTDYGALVDAWLEGRPISDRWPHALPWVLPSDGLVGITAFDLVGHMPERK